MLRISLLAITLVILAVTSRTGLGQSIAGRLPQVEQSQVEPVPFQADSPGLLTLERIESMAIQLHPALARAGARVSAAYGNWLQVGLLPNPSIGYMGTEMGNNGGTSGQQGAYVGQQFVLGKKLYARRQEAAQSWQRAQQEYAAVHQQVVTDVRTSFYRVLIAQRTREVSQSLVATGDEGVRAAQALLDAQEASRVDLLQAQVEAETARILLGKAENRYRGAWRLLAATAGQPEMPPTPLAGDPTSAIPETNWEAALTKLLSESPELAVAQAEAERARASYQRALREPIPDVNVQLALQHDNGTGDEITSVQVGLPLPLFNRNQGRIRETRDQIVVAESGIDRLELQLQARLARVYEQYRNARLAVTRYQQNILPQAKESLDLIGEGYRQGEFNYVTLLTAQRTFFRSNIAYLEALDQLHINRIAIEGLLLRNSLEDR